MIYKFKTANSVSPTVGQEFPTTKPVFRLNKATGELEETGDVIDIQEVIDSCLSTCLDNVLERLMPKVEEAKDVIEYDNMLDDLDVAMEVCNRAEEYRKSLKLSDNLSVSDIYNEVSKQAEILKAKIDTANTIKTVKDMEVKHDEKKETE